MPELSDLKKYFEQLVGEKSYNKIPDIKILEEGNELGYSQINEILLLLGFNRVNYQFFQFLVNGEIEYKLGSSFKTEADLKEGVDRFRELALLWFGNIKSAFNKLAENENELLELIFETEPYELDIYKMRHKPVNDIIPIPKNKTYLLGFISGENLKRKLKNNPGNSKYKKLLKEREKFIKLGMANQASYLTFDHLDIYIATSMRLEHEFINVHEIVQEADTFGKDSELASTLAQGKPVIAYIPKGDKEFVDKQIETLKMINEEEIPEQKIILEQLKIYSQNSPWEKENLNIREWIEDYSKADIQEMKTMLYQAVKDRYNKRASVLQEFHPLGVQVNLKSGVANGVLVVRTVEDCALLIKSIVLNNMKFEIQSVIANNCEYLYLKEKISNCIFRLQTGDKLLTNAFWNFYLSYY